MSALQIIAMSAFLWLLWKALKTYLAHTPLDNVPGPASPSFLSGKHLSAGGSNALNVASCIAGHMGPLYDRHEGWSFNRYLGDNFHSVARLKGLFGVSSVLKTGRHQR